jgi:hypothetical protein
VSISYVLDRVPDGRFQVVQAGGQAVRRSPLVFPTCSSCPAPNSYDQDFAAIWPTGAPTHRDYLLANCWGIPVSVNGVPLALVPGVTSSKHPERFLSYCFDLYPRAYQDQWFVENQLRGYRTVVFSCPDMLALAGLTLAQFRASCQRAKDAGFFVQVKIWSKNFSPLNMTPAAFFTYVQPMFDALAGVVDEYAFWEYDSGNLDGDPALEIHAGCGDRAHAQGASFWAHFFPAHAHWDPLGDAHWWSTLGRHIDGLDYQSDSSWDIGDLQARTVDILRLFGSTGHKLRQFEPGTPTLMFDGDHPTEDEADAIGFLSACTKGDSKVWGCGAGLRLPNGDPVIGVAA